MKEDVVTYENIGIRKATFKYKGVTSWEYILEKMILSYIDSGKMDKNN